MLLPHFQARKEKWPIMFSPVGSHIAELPLAISQAQAAAVGRPRGAEQGSQ